MESLPHGIDNWKAYRHHLSPEETLLLLCARRELPAELQEEASTLARTVDWEQLVDFALQHRVGPMVHAALRKYLSDAVPDVAQARLRQDAIAATQGNLVLLRELLQLARQLSTHGIRFAVFKGLAINQMVYRDLGIRKCGDIDLLVGRQDFARTRALLLADGFAPTLSETVERQCLQSGLWHEQRRVNIDLHWGIPPRELGIRSDLILERATPLIISGQALPAFAAEDMLILLCVNATKEYWNQLLYPYCDIHEFLCSHPDLDLTALRRRAGELHCERMVAAALAVVAALFASPAGVYAVTADADERVVRELLYQLFEPEDVESTFISAHRRLYCFTTTDDYFSALIDTPWRRLAYRFFYIPLRRIAPAAIDTDDPPLPRYLSFLQPLATVIMTGGIVMRETWRKLKKRL